MYEIYVEAADVWDYYNEHKDKLHSDMEVIAERIDFGVTIYLTENGGFPFVIVMVDDEETEGTVIVNSDDCNNTVLEFYDRYLSDDFLSASIDDAKGYTAAEQLEMIDDRELEIDDAVYTLLTILVPNLHEVADDPDDLCDDLKEHICEYLFKKHDISIYRPMYLECEDGTDEFFEFPYSEMEFDD